MQQLGCKCLIALGFTGAMIGGVLTASSVLGYGTLMDIFTNRNLINDLTNV